MDSFIKQIEHLRESDVNLYSEVMNFISIKTFSKGEILQTQSENNGSVYFIRSGMLRSYTIDERGKEHIFMFAPEGWLMSDGTSFNEPNALYIDVLENVEVEVISQKIFEERFISLTRLNSEDGLISMAKRISVLQKRIIMLMSASAIERYEDFTRTYPGVSQRVPQKMIASYLGITPEALSKVKGEKARAK